MQHAALETSVAVLEKSMQGSSKEQSLSKIADCHKRFFLLFARALLRGGQTLAMDLIASNRR